MKPNNTYPTGVPKGTILRRIGKAALLRKVVGSSMAALFTLGSLAPFAQAGQTWDGGNATANWADANNWNPDGVANFGALINFNNNPAILALNNNATGTLAGISFDAGAGAFVLGGGAVANSGAITNNSGNLQTINMGITLSAAQTWTAAFNNLAFGGNIGLASFALDIAGGNNTTITGVISGAGTLNKGGGGVLSLNGANTYTGVTNINVGTVALGNATALGAAGAGNQTVVANNAVLDLNGQAVVGELLSIIGNGGGNGALQNNSGTGSNTGAVTLTGAASVGGTSALVLTGVVTGAFDLTKVGAGALTLNNAANAFGNLVVTGGAGSIVNLLGGGAVPDASNVTLGANTVLNVNAAETIARVTGAGTVNLNTLLTIGASGTGFTLDSTLQAANGITYSKAGQTIIVSGNNTYQGATTVTAGTVQLGNNNALGNFAGSTTTVNSGAVLNLAGFSPTENLDINGNGPGATGVLINSVAGTSSTVTGTVNMSGNSMIGIADATSTITLNGAVTGGGSTLDKFGPGTLNLTGGAAANTYTGLTTVLDGTLGLGKNAGVNAIAGSLNIGNSAGAAGSAVTLLNASEQIINTSNVTIASDGQLNRNGNNETINNLIITSGSVIGAGTLTITDLNMTAGTIGGGNTVLTGNATATNVGAVPAIINDNLTLGGAVGSRTITVNPSAGIAVGTAVAASPHLNITGVISSGVNNNGFTKEGTGTLQINNANTYVGQTVINNGIVLVGNNNAAGTPFGTAAGNTVVNPNGTILLQNGAFTGAEPITVTGAGFNPGSGALGNIAVVAGGSATVNGPVTVIPAVVGGSSFITAGQGNTLNFTGGITKTGTNLVIGNPNAGATLANSGTVNINTAPITGGALGSFNSDVLYTTGVTNLAVANNYLGVTWINNGAQVNANAAGALPSLVTDGGNALTRTALVMDANGAAPFTNVAAYPVPPVGATNSNAASTLTFGGNQAVQWVAGENNASSINIGAFNLTIGTNLGTPGFNNAIAGGAAADNGSNTGPVFKGVISGTGQLIKDGASRQTLTGQSTYTGFTQVNGGVLQVGNANVPADAALVSNLGPSLVFVNAGNLDINLTNGGAFANTVFTVVGTAVRGISNAGITNTIAGSIQGTGGFTQLGAGTTILTNTNLYVGPTNVNAGTLQVGNGIGGSIAAGSTVNLANAATLNINLGANGTFGSPVNITNAGIVIASSANVQTISGNILQAAGAGGTFTMAGTGRTILTGNNTYTGATTVNTGILQIGDGTTLNTSIAPSGTVQVNGTATLAVNLPNAGAFNNNVNLNAAGTTLNTLVAAGATNTIGGNIVGAAGTNILQSGAGTAILTGNNAGFAGTTTIAAGTLQLGNGGAGGALGNGNIVNNGILVLDGNQAAYGNLISGNGSLVKQQAVATTLNGVNTYNGLTTVAGGTLIMGNANALGSTVNGTNVLVGATLDLNGQNVGFEDLQINGTGVANAGALLNGAAGAATLAGTVNMVGNSNIGTTGNLTLNGVVSGPGNLNKVGAGTLFLNAANNYTGTTTVTAGTLQIGNGVSGSILPGAGVTVNGGATLALNLAPNAVFGNAIANAGTINEISANTNTLSGVISGVGTFNQNGTGRTILTGANTYTGATTVNGGTLQIGDGITVGSTIAPSGAVTVNGASTLAINLTNGGVFANPVNMTAAGNINTLTTAGNTNTLTGALTGANGTFTQSGAGVVILNAAGTNYGGTTTIAAGTLQLGLAGANGGLGGGNIVNNGALIFDGAANVYNNVISGVGTVTKNQNNITTLGGANTYTGLTTVTAGTLQLANPTALGSTNAGTVVQAGAALDLNGQNVGAEALQIAGNGVGAGALVNNAAAASSLQGPVTLTGDTTIGSTVVAPNTGNITLGGNVNGNFNLTKTGVNTLTLSGFNGYTGTTNINQGVVIANNNQALGTVIGGLGTIVLNGASLQLANGINVVAEPLTINGAGTGAFSPGALTQSAGASSSYSGPITVASASTISTNGAGTLTLTPTATINKTDVVLTINGGGRVVANGAITGGNFANFNDDLIVDAATILDLNAANTYLGPTFIRNGSTINANIANALPTLNGRTTIAMDVGVGTLALFNANQAIASLASVNAGSAVNLGANTLTIGFGTAPNANGTANANFNGVISGGSGNQLTTPVNSIVKDDNSTQIFSGANTYTGATVVNGGTLQAGIANVAFGVNSPTTVAAGATLALNGFSNSVASLAGAGTVNNANAAAVTLTLTGAVTGGTAPNTNFSGVISQTNGVINLVKNGGSTQTLSGINTYTGTTTVNNNGTLLAGSTQAFGINSAVTLNNTGTLDLGGFNNTIGSLNSNAGGTFVQSTGGAATLTTGTLNTNDTFVGVIRDGQAPNPGVLSLAKVGNGSFTLSGNNSYTGTTTIAAAGAIIANNNNALGATTGNTTVANGATLIINNGIALAAETLNLNGAGNGFAPGALAKQAGAGVASVSGNIVAQTNSTIHSNGGTLSLLNPNGTTTITKTAVNLTLAGNGTANDVINANSIIQGNSGAFNSDLIVTNTLVNLNAANTYFGPTFIRTTNGLVGGVNANVASALPGSANVNLNDRTSVTMDDLAGNGGSNLSIVTSQNISSLAGIAAAGPIAASTVNISNGQTLTIGFNTAAVPANGTNNANFAGNIGGAGSLVKDGTSTQRLSGTNTFTGTVAVNGGVLELQNGNAIANTVNVTVSNPGTLTLITSETIGSLASLPTAPGNAAGGTVQLNGQTLTTGGSASTTFNGQITGAGASNLVKEGATTFILTGANNNYAGTTTVNGGTLQIGIAPIVTVPPTPQVGSIGAGAVQVNNGSTLTIINTTGNALANNISANVGAGTVIVNSANNNTLSGVLSNVNVGTILSLQQNGTGRTTLTGANTYTGTTQVNASTLNVLGSHIGGANYAVAANATLAGTGNIRLAAGASVNNLGTISVGNANIANILPLSGQILTIGTSGAGAINMGAGSVLAVDILGGVTLGNNTGNATQADRLNLIGTLNATNGGTLVIGNPNGLVGFRGGDAWLLINNDSDANGVNEGVIVGTLGLNDTALGLTATQVGNFNQTSGIYTVIDTITGLQMANIQGQSVMSAAQGMLNDINGRLFFLRAGYGERGYNGSLQASMDFGVEYGEGDGKSAKDVTPVVASDAPEWQAFINANYQDVKIDAIGNQQAGFDSDTWTGGFGIERAFTNNLTFGFAANWLESRQDYTNGVGKLDMSGIALSAYGSYVRKAFWADLLYSFGSFDIDTERDPIGFPTAQGRTDAQTHAVQFNTGWNFRFQENTLVTGPFAGVDYMHASVDGFSETSGGLAALNYNSRSYDSLISRIGWSVSKKVDTSFAKITAQARLAYERQNIKYDGQTSVSLINQPFTATSAEQNIGQDYMSAGAGVNFQFTPNFGLLLNYQGQFFRQNVQAHWFGIRAGISF